MRKKRKKEKFPLTQEEIEKLFNKFSHPFRKSAVTESQKFKTLEISKILWLLLVTNHDTDENIYNALKNIFIGVPKKQESCMVLGSLYFLGMKEALSSGEIKKLQKHYSSLENFYELEHWAPTSDEYIL